MRRWLLALVLSLVCSRRLERQLAPLAHQRTPFVDEYHLWPQVVPFVVIRPTDFSLFQLRAISNALSYLNHHLEGCLEFRDATPVDTQVVAFRAVPLGCSTNLGYQGTGSVEDMPLTPVHDNRRLHFVNLGPTCEQGSILHELCHVLGMAHEQTRLDRDQYIHVVTENIMPGKLSQFEKHRVVSPNNEAALRDIGDYDLASIMHYGRYADSVNGHETIQVLTPNMSRIIGNRKGLTQKDLDTLLSAYNCQPKNLTLDWIDPYPIPEGLSILEHKHHKCVIRSRCKNPEQQRNMTFNLHFETCNGVVFSPKRHFAMRGCTFGDVPMAPCSHGCTTPYFSCKSNSECPDGHRCDLNGKCDVLILSNLDLCPEHHCANNGTCVPIYLDYRCSCTSGFGGKTCELKIASGVVNLVWGRNVLSLSFLAVCFSVIP